VVSPRCGITVVYFLETVLLWGDTRWWKNYTNPLGYDIETRNEFEFWDNGSF
jgi:hypothetical protein